MAHIEIADAHLPHLTRLSREYSVELTRLVNLIIAIGIETLEAVEFVDGIDEPIVYELNEELEARIAQEQWWQSPEGQAQIAKEEAEVEAMLNGLKEIDP